MANNTDASGQSRQIPRWAYALIGLILLLGLAGLIYRLTRPEQPESAVAASPVASPTQTAATTQITPTQIASTQIGSTTLSVAAIPDCTEPPMAVYGQPETPLISAEALPTLEVAGQVPADPIAMIQPAGQLLAHWSFDGDEGPQVSDSSGNGNTAVLTRPDMLSPDAGQNGGALAYQNGADSLVPAEETSLQALMTAPFLQRTVALWLNAEDTTTPQILYEEGGPGDGMALRLRDGLLEARVVTTVDGETLIGQVVYPYPATGEWHHVAATFNSGVLILFLDGEPVAFADNVPFAVVGGHPDPAAIGNTSGVNAFADGTDAAYSGLLDDVAVYGKDFVEPLPAETAVVTIVPSPTTAAGATVEITATPSLTPTGTPQSVAAATTASTASPTLVPTVAPPRATATPPAPISAPIAAIPAPVGAIQGLPLLDLPFPYDGGNEGFGGDASLFRAASQGPTYGGRVTSYYDHLYPLYPAPEAGNITNGREPADLPFGGQMLPFDGVLRETIYSGHPGFDFAPYERGLPTTPVFAAADGVISRAGIHAASGAYYVEIQHRTEAHGDFLTRYWHLEPDAFFEATRERVGDPVAAGERIGTVGNTGWSTGYHLHFEVRHDRNEDGVFALNETIDPFGFIPSAAYPEDPWQTAGSFIDGRGQTYRHPGSQSYYLWKHLLGRSAQIPATGGGQLVQYDGVGGEGGAELCVPENALPPGSTVNWSWIPDPPPSPGLVGTGHGCTLSAIAPDGSQIARFDVPVQVVVPFDAADLANVENPAETLAIYWQRPGSTTYEKLDTTIDLATGLASAVTEYPGVCALLGLPNRDLVPPRTEIHADGPKVGDVFVGPVSVSLSSADGDVALTRYSLDGGTTWQPYTGPFPLPGGAQSLGAPDPLLAGEGVEGLVRGPGRYLVLAAGRDLAGNEEYPAAAEIIYIEPFLPTPTIGPTAPPPTPNRRATAAAAATRTAAAATAMPTPGTPTPTGTTTPTSGGSGPPIPGSSPPATDPPPPPTNTPFSDEPYPSPAAR